MTDHITIPRALLEQALEQLQCNTDNLRKGMSRSIQKLCARENEEVLETLRAELAKQEGFEWPACKACGGSLWKCMACHPEPPPAWHDAQEVAALKAERDAAMKDAERYRWLAAHTRSTSEHWGGRWSIVIDGPVPKRHDCEDAFDEAIDAAIAKAEGRTE